MSSRIREALADLERDVAALRLATPQAVRAHGRARQRRRTAALATTIVAGMAVTGAAVAPLYQGRGGSDGQPQQVAAGPTPSGSASTPAGCTSPATAPPTKSDADTAKAIADSRTVWVVLQLTATPNEKAAIDTALHMLNTVTTIEFVGREQQWQSFVNQFCDAPEIVAATKPDQLPEEFDITLDHPDDYAHVKAAIGSMAGVDELVRVPSDQSALHPSSSLPVR
jgi:hypothetical protein